MNARLPFLHPVHLEHPDLPKTIGTIRMWPEHGYDRVQKHVVLEADKLGGCQQVAPACHPNACIQMFIDSQRMVVRCCCSKCEAPVWTFPLKIAF